MALKSCRQQFLGRERERDVLKHRPNVSHAISAPLEKHNVPEILLMRQKAADKCV